MNMYRKLECLYESLILTEMTGKVVDYLNNHLQDLSFPHLFNGDDVRQYIPISNTPEVLTTLDDLFKQYVKDYSHIDYDTEEVVRNIKLDPKYGGGNKEQRINIGRVINATTIPNNDKKHYLDWLAKHKGHLKELMKSNYGMIISRAPIDLLRMADHENMSSCHSRGGSHFHCAVQEAINGGAVVNVVKNRDAQDIINSGRLQDDEIYYDKERSIQGIKPVARLRVRRLEDDNGDVIGVPDSKVYGDTSIPGFYDSLKKFLKGKQPQTANDFRSGKQWSTRGASYFDQHQAAHDLLARYFDVPVTDDPEFDHVYHNVEDKISELNKSDEISKLGATLGEDCDQIADQYNARYLYCSTNWQEEEEEHLLIRAIGDSSFDVPDTEEINFVLDNRMEIYMAKKGKYDSDVWVRWSTIINYFDSLVFLTSFKFYGGEITMNFRDEELVGTTTEFTEFCERVKNLDDSIKELLTVPNKLQEFKLRTGIINPTKIVKETYLKYLIW
jgi:hypothetical protein